MISDLKPFKATPLSAENKHMWKNKKSKFQNFKNQKTKFQKKNFKKQNFKKQNFKIKNSEKISLYGNT